MAERLRESVRFTAAVFLDWLTAAKALIRGRQVFRLHQSSWRRGVRIRHVGRPTRELAFQVSPTPFVCCPFQVSLFSLSRPVEAGLRRAWWRRLVHVGGCEAFSLRRLCCRKQLRWRLARGVRALSLSSVVCMATVQSLLVLAEQRWWVTHINVSLFISSSGFGVQWPASHVPGLWWSSGDGTHRGRVHSSSPFLMLVPSS